METHADNTVGFSSTRLDLSIQPLAKALTRADLQQHYKEQDLYRFFAPTDAAFTTQANNFLVSIKYQLILTQILLNHVSGTVTITDLQTGYVKNIG
jgi:uncharacterized surface protein with fasciclin (FAS1) repeats